MCNLAMLLNIASYRLPNSSCRTALVRFRRKAWSRCQNQKSRSARPAKARPRTRKLTSRPHVLIAIAILFTGIYGLDYSAGRELSLWALYIVPIALGTFAMGPRCGIMKQHPTIARTDYSNGAICVTQTSQSTCAGNMHLA